MNVFYMISCSTVCHSGPIYLFLTLLHLSHFIESPYQLLMLRVFIFKTVVQKPLETKPLLHTETLSVHCSSQNSLQLLLYVALMMAEDYFC